jgi:hypothetical protein
MRGKIPTKISKMCAQLRERRQNFQNFQEAAPY